MSNPTAAMALMFSERLQKMRDATGTAYVEGEGFGEGEGSVRFRDVFFFVIVVSPVEATSASSA